MLFKKPLLFLCFVFLTTLAWAQKNKTHYEDLSSLRPHFETNASTAGKTDTLKAIEVVLPVKNINVAIDAILDSIDRFNLTRKFVEGFTIQIYSGQNREDAMNAKKKMSTISENMISYMQYQQPKFRVTVGKYLSRLEAQKDLVFLSKHFSTTILVPEKIVVR